MDDGHISAVVPVGVGTVDVRVQSGITTSSNTHNYTNPIFGYGISANTANDNFTFGAGSGGSNILHWDFGTSSSPLATGYTRVTEATKYSGALGYGWQSSSIASRDRGTGTDLTRDFNFTSNGTFAVDLANGTYDVTLTLGDRSYSHDQMGVFLEGTQVDSVTAPAGQFVTRSYTATVSDGQLTLQLKDLGGSDGNTVIDGLDIAPAEVMRWDFGTSTSPVGTGYTRVSEAIKYSTALGYGWQSGTIASRDRGVGDELTRDFNFTSNGTFAVDLANGTYDVTVTLGDRSYSHDQMGLLLEGTQVDSVTAPAGQFVTRTYPVTVSDGQLTLQLKDLGGSDGNAVIDSLEIVAA